jgi:hypothetical protein
MPEIVLAGQDASHVEERRPPCLFIVQFKIYYRFERRESVTDSPGVTLQNISFPKLRTQLVHCLALSPPVIGNRLRREPLACRQSLWLN